MSLVEILNLKPGDKVEEGVYLVAVLTKVVVVRTESGKIVRIPKESLK